MINNPDNNQSSLSYLKGLKNNSTKNFTELYYLLQINNYLSPKDENALVLEEKTDSKYFFGQKTILDLSQTSRYQILETHFYDPES